MASNLRQEIIIRLCQLCKKVAESQFDFPRNPVDCFCSRETKLSSFHFTLEILDFIEKAVKERIKETKLHP